ERSLPASRLIDMDISPKTLREVEFREKLRGYHPEDVDEFLERVADSVDALQERLRQATERAVHAEQLASETGDTDDAIRRTLVLAQRTADTAVQEARDEAGQIVERAQGEAGDIVAAARQEADEIARQAQVDLRADLEQLNDARDRLRREVAAVQEWLETHRGALTTGLATALHQLDADLVTSPPPPAEAVVLPPEPGATQVDETEETDESHET